MTRTPLIGMLLACLKLSLGAAAAGPLVVALPDAPAGYASVLSRVVLRPYRAATRQAVRVQTSAAPVWDLAQLDPVTVAQGCADGRLAKIDWAQLGGRGRLLAMAESDCGVGAYLTSTVLTWDAGKVPGSPNWGDFWNVVRVPGRRGLRKTPVGTLEIALMADGVAPRDVYAVLRGTGGVERAFRKLDQLRPYIVWWQRDSEPMAIVAAGGAVMSSAPDDRVIAASRTLHRRFGVQWDGSIVLVQSWAVRSTTRLAGAALALIRAASDPVVQAQLVGSSGLGVTAAVDPKTLDAAVSPAAHLGDAVPFDAGFWRDHQAALAVRFDAWLKH
jgi:putative spermidine/putrescine transport system substrate-binding protein